MAVRESVETERKLVPLAQGIEEVIGRRVSPPCAWRWWRKGVRGIKLKVHHFGGRVYVTREALAEFAAAISVAKSGNVPAPSTPPARSQEPTRLGGNNDT